MEFHANSAIQPTLELNIRQNVRRRRPRFTRKQEETAPRVAWGWWRTDTAADDSSEEGWSWSLLAGRMTHSLYSPVWQKETQALPVVHAFISTASTSGAWRDNFLDWSSHKVSSGTCRNEAWPKRYVSPSQSGKTINGFSSPPVVSKWWPGKASRQISNECSSIRCSSINQQCCFCSQENWLKTTEQLFQHRWLTPIKYKFYADDCLKSLPSEAEARRI